MWSEFWWHPCVHHDLLVFAECSKGWFWQGKQLVILKLFTTFSFPLKYLVKRILFVFTYKDRGRWHPIIYKSSTHDILTEFSSLCLHNLHFLCFIVCLVTPLASKDIQKEHYAAATRKKTL